MSRVETRRKAGRFDPWPALGLRSEGLVGSGGWLCPEITTVIGIRELHFKYPRQSTEALTAMARASVLGAREEISDGGWKELVKG